MSHAAPLLRIPVGVVIERRKADSQWIDFTWCATAVLPDTTDMKPWTVLRDSNGVTSFYAGEASVDLYASETARYRENLATGAAGIWVVMSPSDAEIPYKIEIVTADPAEGEGYTEVDVYLVEQVPMPKSIRDAVDLFVGQHHVETPFVKRQRNRVDPEAMARHVRESRDDE